MTRETPDRCPEEEGFVARYACGGCDDDEQRLVRGPPGELRGMCKRSCGRCG